MNATIATILLIMSMLDRANSSRKNSLLMLLLLKSNPITDPNAPWNGGGLNSLIPALPTGSSFLDNALSSAGLLGGLTKAAGIFNPQPVQASTIPEYVPQTFVPPTPVKTFDPATGLTAVTHVTYQSPPNSGIPTPTVPIYSGQTISGISATPGQVAQLANPVGYADPNAMAVRMGLVNSPSNEQMQAAANNYVNMDFNS